MERVVTAARPRDDQRLALELDGRRWIVLDALTAARLGLEEGRSLDDAAVARAEDEARHERALHRAATMVGRRSHARADLERRVARRDGADAASAAAERLAAIGAVDDERHAAELIDLRLRQGWGPARIEHDLLEAGVEEALVRAAVAAIDPERVGDAARIALGSRTGADGWRRLAARGFDEDVAERLAGPLDDA